MLEALPELKGQGFDALIREVFLTGVPYQGKETPAQLLRNGRLETSYYNFVFQPLYDAQGQILGVLDVAIDVTEQIMTRKRVEESEERLQGLNEQLRATLNKLQAAHAETYRARAEADLQRRQLYNILIQAPAMICIFEGPTHVFKLVNPPYQQLVGERPLLGKPIAEAMPELASQPIFGLLNQVYRTLRRLFSTCLRAST